jgi:hypothetical protein
MDTLASQMSFAPFIFFVRNEGYKGLGLAAGLLFQPAFGFLWEEP